MHELRLNPVKTLDADAEVVRYVFGLEDPTGRSGETSRVHTTRTEAACES